MEKRSDGGKDSGRVSIGKKKKKKFRFEYDFGGGGEPENPSLSFYGPSYVYGKAGSEKRLIHTRTRSKAKKMSSLTPKNTLKYYTVDSSNIRNPNGHNCFWIFFVLIPSTPIGSRSRAYSFVVTSCNTTYINNTCAIKKKKKNM